MGCRVTGELYKRGPGWCALMRHQFLSGEGLFSQVGFCANPSSVVGVVYFPVYGPRVYMSKVNTRRELKNADAVEGIAESTTDARGDMSTGETCFVQLARWSKLT
jgi:hypothetical protein